MPGEGFFFLSLLQPVCLLNHRFLVSFVLFLSRKQSIIYVYLIYLCVLSLRLCCVHVYAFCTVAHFVAAVQDGLGTESWPDKSRFIGEFSRGKKSGSGVSPACFPRGALQ